MSDWETNFQILRQIVRGEWNQLRQLSPGLRESDDSFPNFVIEQHLHHFVAGRLTADQQADALPQHWMERLRQQIARYQNARQRLKQRLAQACTLFSNSNLDCRVLKGIPFAQRYMGDMNLRRWGDIDLLVHQQDADRALGILWELGYREPTMNAPAISDAMLRRGHELTVVHDECQIDLHWRFRTAPAYRWRDSQIWVQPNAVRIDDVTYPILSDEYALVLLLVSIAHDIARGGCRLKHFLDVRYLLRCPTTEIDWPVFFENRRAENNLKIAVNMLRMSLDVWEEKDDLPELREILHQYKDLQVGGGRSRALELIRSPRGGVENKLWFAKIYGVQLTRDARWIIARSVPHPRRWPAVFWQLMRSCGKRLAG